MNNWDLYDIVEGLTFAQLKQKLKAKYSTAPVTIMQWGFTQLGKPFVVVKADRADLKERPVKPEPKASPAAAQSEPMPTAIRA